MSTQMELTLGELARIALGSPTLGPANIAVLHSLIDLLLKKLDCREEKVSIGGYETCVLRKILQQTTVPSYAFQEDKIVVLKEKFEHMKALEARVEAVSARLEKHFDEIRECNKEGLDDVFHYRNWERYADFCEDLCIECEPENEIACELLSNTDFMKKIMRIIAHPLVERMFNFEQRVEQLHEDFTKFMEETKEHYMKMALVERCIEEIEKLRHQVDEHHLQFLGAMEEVQDMFDAKLDKIHLPALKKYVRDRFDKIERTLESLRHPKTCPESAGVIISNLKCLSCGNDRVCTDKSVVTKGVLPDAHARKDFKILKQYCGCQYPPVGATEPQLTCQNFQFQGKGVLQNKRVRPATCLCKAEEYKFIQGKDGAFYRMDANAVDKNSKNTNLDDNLEGLKNELEE